MSWPSKKAGSDPLLWGRNSISDVIADARASLQQPSRPFTPRNLAQVRLSFFTFYHSILRLSSGSLTSRAHCSSIGAAPVNTSSSAPSCACPLFFGLFSSNSLVQQLLDLSSNRPVTPAPDSWLAQLRTTRDKLAPAPSSLGWTREKDRTRSLSWDSSSEQQSSAPVLPEDSTIVVFDGDDFTNPLPPTSIVQPTLCPSPPPRAAHASTSTLRSSRPLMPSRSSAIAAPKSLDSQILNVCCQLDSESSTGSVEAVVAQALQMLAAANADSDGSCVSEPMRRALVKSVSARMTTDDPQRLLDFSSVLLAALQPGSSRNRTVVKVIYKVSKTSSNDPLFAARPRLLQLMAEAAQASSDLDVVL